jgi:RNA polymerase sigma factor (sigma-70 family)
MATGTYTAGSNLSDGNSRMSVRSVDALLQYLRRLGDKAAPSEDAVLLERFVADNDREAFELLIAHHGPMVLGTARRLVDNTHDAEDVFQAVFLSLARLAKTIRQGRTLPAWLHKTTSRIAAKVRRNRASRSNELPAEPCEHVEPGAELVWREVRQALDEELQKLPEQLRSPLLLCYLSGLTRDEAARQLGWSISTLRRRLEEGRNGLRTRLERRGIAAVGLALAALDPKALQAALNKSQVESILSLVFVKGSVAPATISSIVLSSAAVKGLVMKSMLASLAAVAIGFGIYVAMGSADPAKKADENKEIAKVSEENKVDLTDDPLPEGAVFRLGSPRFRHPGATIALSADGKELMTCSSALKNVRIWDAATGKIVKEFTIDGAGRLGAIAWAPDQKTFATSESLVGNNGKPGDSVICIRDAQSGKVIRSIACPRGTIRYLGSGKEIAVQIDGDIAIWELETGVELIKNTFLAARRSNSDFGVSADGRRIAVVGPYGSGDVYVWDWQSGKEPHTLKTDSKGIPRGVTVSPDGKQLALLDDKGGPIRLFDADNGKLLREFRLPERKPNFSTAVFTPDGKKLLADDDGGRTFRTNESEPGGVIVWDVATGKLERELKVASFCARVAISANGNFIAAEADGFPIWELPSGKRVNPLSEGDLAVSDQVTARAGLILAFGFYHPARLWDEKTGQLLHTFPHKGLTRACALSPDGARAATSASDDLIKVWETSTGKLIMTLPGHDDMNGTLLLRFSADGRKLVSFGTDSYLRVTDLSNGKAIREFPIRLAEPGLSGSNRNGGLDDTLTSALSADGCRLCLSSDGTKNHLFDTDTGKEVATLEFEAGQSGLLEKPVFSPDGTLLLMMGRGKPTEVPIKGGGVRYEPAKVNLLTCWDAKSGRRLWDVMQTSLDTRLAFAPSGRTFAVCKYGGWESANTVEFRDTATGGLLGQLDKLPIGPLRSIDSNVEFTPDDKRIILTMMDGTVLLHNVPDFKK